MIVPVAALVIAAGLGGYLITNTAKLPGGPAVKTKVIGTTGTVAGVSIGGPFTLTNHRGEVVTEKDLSRQTHADLLRLHPLSGYLPDDDE